MCKAKKSSFYHTRKKLMIEPQKAAEILHFSPEKIIAADYQGNELAERFLLLYNKTCIGVEGWENWCFSRGVLKHHKQQWTPKGILADREFRTKIEEDCLLINRLLSQK